MIITKKKFTALIEKEKTKAFVEGYEKGVSAGKQEMLFNTVTPNYIREVFGLPPLGKEDTKVTTEKMEVKEMTQQEYENEIKELKERITKLEAEKIEVEQPKRWKPNNKEVYWIVQGNGNAGKVSWDDNNFDNWLYLTGNCFKTKKEAEEYKKQIEYTARYKNYIEEHSEPLDWKNASQMKYGAWFGFSSDDIHIEQTAQGKDQGAIYASSEQIIWDAIKEIGEDNFKKYVLGVK